MPDRPDFGLCEHIVDAFRWDDFMLIIIWGPLRIGKSAFALKCLGQVYDYFFGEPLSVDLLKKYMGFHPRKVIDDWTRIKKRIPMYVWDDAGYWLYSLDWNDPLLKAIQKYMNVIGTDMNCLMLTTPDPRWILSKIVNMPGAYRGRVIKTRGPGSWDGLNRDSFNKLWARNCRGYNPWLAPDLKKSGVNPHWDDNFFCYLDKEIYEYYKPERDKYTSVAKENVQKILMGEIADEKTEIRRDTEALTENR